MRNPFKPTAGARPPLLVGRDRALDVFREGIEDGPGAPGLLTVLTGQRGAGKTVMLGEAESFARTKGWVVISDTATRGLLSRLTREMRPHLAELGSGPRGRRVSGASVGGWGIQTELPPIPESTARETAADLTGLLAERGTGLLITIDEIHAIDRTELQELAAITQHLIREDLPIGLMVAGIPRAVSDLLNDDVSTFLRRADPVALADVPVPAVQDALLETFESTGVPIDVDQAARAAGATGGYPFLIQLVGYHIWRLARDGRVSDEVVDQGIEAARRRLGATVLQPALADLSAVDRTFLLKMAEDGGPSRTADIAARMGVDQGYVSVYRQRLLAAGMIVETSRGAVDYFVPDLRSYLREHIASDVTIESSSEHEA